MCPGNHRSAGQTQGSKTTQGKRWLRGALTECAWGVSAQKNCFLKEKFWRLATKKQRQPPATRALAHTLWVLGYQVLRAPAGLRSAPRPEHAVPHSHVGVFAQKQPGLNFVGAAVPVGQITPKQMLRLAERMETPPG